MPQQFPSFEEAAQNQQRWGSPPVSDQILDVLSKVGTIGRNAVMAGPDFMGQFMKGEVPLEQAGPEALKAMATYIGMNSVPGLVNPGSNQAILNALKALRGPVTSHPDFVYHATNISRAQEIMESGSLKTHKPSNFTDQRVWPDGSSEKRNYFTPTAQNTWQFAPEEEQGVLLRIPKDAHPFKRESTGDLYSTKPVPSHKIEALHENGEWMSLKRALSSGN